MLFGKKYCGSTVSHPCPLLEFLGRLTLQNVSADNPRSFSERMVSGYFAAVDSQPECSRANVEKSGGIGQVHPWLLLVGLIARNAVMAAQCGDPLSGPTISASGKVAIAI